jgi:hypothetical protein
MDEFGPLHLVTLIDSQPVNQFIMYKLAHDVSDIYIRTYYYLESIEHIRVVVGHTSRIEIANDPGVFLVYCISD